jgi:hypothetical protein
MRIFYVPTSSFHYLFFSSTDMYVVLWWTGLGLGGYLEGVFAASRVLLRTPGVPISAGVALGAFLAALEMEIDDQSTECK